MGVAVVCPECGSRFQVAPEVVGRRGRCPRCQQAFVAAPAPTDGAAAAAKATKQAAKPAAKKKPAAAKLTVERIAAAFVGPIEPVRTTLTYHLGILVATVMMVLVPLVYLALIGLFGYAVYYHAVNHTEILTATRGRGAIAAALVYGAPLVIGPILILFMLKPFFSRPARRDRSRSLVRENEPLLFAFVDKICEAVGSPRPRRIDVDCQVNASAGFRRGLLSFFGGDLVLTIGMPLVAGLSACEFGGVLAHEFGHFSQGIGMRLTYLLRSLAAWLVRVVYERDAWDEWLASAASVLDLRLGWIFYLAMLMVWLTRKVLWLLLMASMAVVGYVLRQMEYDADRYEARLAGSGEFASTTKKMVRLGAATQLAYSQLAGSRLEGKLVDDLPRLILLNLSRLPDAVDAELKRRLESDRTGWFDTHPTDRDRIASAQTEATEGVLRLPGPASRLFGDFDAHCKAATWEFYREALGGNVERSALQPVGELHEEQNELDEAKVALGRYSQGTLRANRRVGLGRDCLTPPESAPDEAQRLKTLRGGFEASVEPHREKLQAWDEQAGKSLTSRVFEEMHRAGVKFPKKDLDETHRTREACVATKQRARRSMAAAERDLEPYERAAGERMTAALRLAQHDAVAKRLPGGEAMRERVAVLVPALNALEGSLDTINSLREQSTVLGALAGVANERGVTEELVARVRAGCRDAHAGLGLLRDVLAVHDYPFDHAEGSAKLGTRLVPSLPSRDELGDVIAATDKALEGVASVQHRLLAELCATAERIETALKLPPLPDPPEEEAEAEGA